MDSLSAFNWELERIDWASLCIAGGRDAADVPDALRALAAATTTEEAEAAYWRLDNRVVVQGCVYEAAEFIIRPLLLLLCNGPTLVRKEVLNLLIELVGSAAFVEGRDRGLLERCRERVREGLATLYWLLGSEDAYVRGWVIDVLEHVEPDADRLLWVLRRVSVTDVDGGVRSVASRIVAERSA